MDIFTILQYVAIGAIVAAVLALVYIGLREGTDEADPFDLLVQGDDDDEPTDLRDAELQRPFRERVLLPIAQRLAGIVIKVTPQKQLEDARHLIELSGQTGDPATFLVKRIVMMVVLCVGGALLGFVVRDETTFKALLYTAGGAVLGYNLPVMDINSKIRKRQDSIQRALPDALDLLVICVEAGLGFDMAMGKVFDKWDNELALAFGRVLTEIQLGRLRREALKDMADRMDVPDVNSFTAAIIQADQLGVSMADILSVQSEQMRIKRRQRAQEKAQQAPVKMMLPLVLLIFPSIWIVLMGPALLSVMDAF
jgi:tight adherence protein C